MTESTKPAQCRDEDWGLARDCGLMAATPGTNAWDAALARFADGIRASTSEAAEDTAYFVGHAAGRAGQNRQKDDDSVARNGDGMALTVATDALIALLPGPYYMDPPDGGSVTVLEQLQRMAKDAARYRWLRDSDRVGDEMEGDILVGAEGGEDVLWDKFMDRAIDAAMSGDPTPDTEIGDLFEGRAVNTPAISANGAVNSRAQIIARAVHAHGRAWPERLTSGVMFYEGERITKAEFLAEVRA